MSLVSIILTSYNKPNTIGLAIESILKQTYQNWELFIMDDNSNKETVQIIKRYVSDKRIHYFNSNVKNSDRYKTTRYATLINEAISKTNGKYITYITDDNVFLPERLEVMAGVLSSNPAIEVVYSQQMVVNEEGEKQFVRKTRGILKNPVGLVDHCSVMHTRAIGKDVYQKYGSYWDDDPAYWFNGDAAFWRRLTQFKAFYPIGKTLDIAYKDQNSFQKLYKFLPNHIPNGTLIKGPKTDVFLLENQERRKISLQYFKTLKYTSEKIVVIPDPMLYKYKEGKPINNQVFSNATLLPNNRLIKSSKNPKIYLLQNNKKHSIQNNKVFNQYNFNRNEVIVLADELINKIPEGVPIGELSSGSLLPDRILYHDQKSYYISINNHLHGIQLQVANKLRLSVSNPVKVDGGFLSQYKKGEPLRWGGLYS